jgi:hypothetical protein
MAKLTQPLTPTEARQGSPRRMNLRVLAGSLALAVIAGLVFYATAGPAPQPESTTQKPGDVK